MVFSRLKILSVIWYFYRNDFEKKMTVLIEIRVSSIYESAHYSERRGFQVIILRLRQTKFKQNTLNRIEIIVLITERGNITILRFCFNIPVLPKTTVNKKSNLRKSSFIYKRGIFCYSSFLF